jgi:hypothetical protein
MQTAMSSNQLQRLLGYISLYGLTEHSEFSVMLMLRTGTGLRTADIAARSAE